MTHVLTTLLVLFVGLVSAWASHAASKRGGRAWALVCGASLLILALLIPAFYSAQLSLSAPFSWFYRGMNKWFFLSAAFPALFWSLAAKLPQGRTARAVRWLSVVVLLRTGFLPAIAPLMSQAQVSAVETIIDPDGVCLQGTSFTCGPAASVTALRTLGIEAKENELSLLFGTSAWGGTPDDVLADKLRQHYKAQGLSVEHRYLTSAQELRQWPVSIVIIKFARYVDHFVVVLGIKDDTIRIGNPLLGVKEMSIKEFEDQWRHVAIGLAKR
jgi:predicted double-glycine peptidase